MSEPTIHELAALHRALASAIEARKTAGDSANCGRDGFLLTVAVDDAKADFVLACQARIQEAAAEYDQQAARIAELEAEVARLRAVQAHYERLLSLARAVTENHAPEESVDMGNLAHYVYHAEKPELADGEAG